MSENSANVEGSPKPTNDEDVGHHTDKTSEPTMPQSVLAVLRRNKGHDIAMKALGATQDYSKSTSVGKLKTVLLERDNELITISKQFLDQEKRIKALKLQVQGKNMEIAKLKQEVKDSSDRAVRFADALIDSVGKGPAPSEKPTPGPSDEPKDPDDGGASNPASPSPDQKPKEEEYSSVFQYEVYRDRIRSLNLDELNMNEEADTMTRAEDCTISEDEPLRYPVPPPNSWAY